MGNIPRYFPQELPPRDVPGRPIPRGLYGAVATDIAEVSADFAEMGRKMQDAQNVSDYNHAMNHAFLSLQDMEDRYKQRTDYKAMEQSAGEEIKALREEVLTDITDPETTELIGMKFDQWASLKMSDIRGHAKQLLVSEGRAASLALLDTLQNAYVEASPHERIIIQGMMDATDIGDIEAGFRTPEEVEKNKQKRIADINRGEVWSDVNKIGPEAVLNRLEAGQYNISSERRFEFERELRREITTRKVEGEKALKEAQSRNFLKYYLMARNKQLRESEIMGLVQRQEVDSGDAVHLIKALDTYEDKTDPETYVKLRVGLTENTMDEKDIIKDHEKLSTGDFEKLYTKATEGEPESTHYKRAVRLFELARQHGVITAVEWANKMNEFENRVGEEKLKGEDITKLAEELINPEKESWIKNLLNSIGNVEYIVWKKIKGEQTVPKKKEGITFTELPPADEHKNELFEDTTTGKRYKSDGTKWIEEK